MCALLGALVYTSLVGIESDADLSWGGVCQGPCRVRLVAGAGGGVGSDVGQESSDFFGSRSFSGGKIGLGEGAGRLLALSGGWACFLLGCGRVWRVEVGVLGVVSRSSCRSPGCLVGWDGVDLDDVGVIVELEDSVGEVLEPGVCRADHLPLVLWHCDVASNGVGYGVKGLG